MESKQFESHLVESRKQLESYAYSLSLNYEDAQDLVQDTMLKALLNKNSFEEGSNMGAWLFTIMKNTFINAYRKKQKTQKIISKEQDTPWINNLSANNIYNADHNAQHTQILLFIKNLPTEQKIPFEMLNQGYKYHEIAEQYHIPIGLSLIHI